MLVTTRLTKKNSGPSASDTQIKIPFGVFFTPVKISKVRLSQEFSVPSNQPLLHFTHYPHSPMLEKPVDVLPHTQNRVVPIPSYSKPSLPRLPRNPRISIDLVKVTIPQVTPKEETPVVLLNLMQEILKLSNSRSHDIRLLLNYVEQPHSMLMQDLMTENLLEKINFKEQERMQFEVRLLSTLEGHIVSDKEQKKIIVQLVKKMVKAFETRSGLVKKDEPQCIEGQLREIMGFKPSQAQREFPISSSLRRVISFTCRAKEFDGFFVAKLLVLYSRQELQKPFRRAALYLTAGLPRSSIRSLGMKALNTFSRPAVEFQRQYINHTKEKVFRTLMDINAYIRGEIRNSENHYALRQLGLE